MIDVHRVNNDFIVPNVNDLISVLNRKSALLFDSFTKILDSNEEKKQKLLEYLSDFNKIMTDSEKIELDYKLISELPLRKLNVEDFLTLFGKMIKHVEEKGKLDSLMKEIDKKIKSEKEAKQFGYLYLENVSIFSKEELPKWQDYLVEEENIDYMLIFNEVIQTLSQLDEFAHKLKASKLIVMYTGIMMILLNTTRISQILLAYENKDYDLAIKLSKFLRAQKRDLTDFI